MTAPDQVRYTEAEVQRWLTCYHEAAHVSMCMLFEIPFDFVTLVTGFWGGIRSGYVRGSQDENPDAVDNEIIMMYAGLAAEDRWLELHPGHGTVKESNGGGDTAMARELMERYDTSSVPFLRRRADALVLNRWENIERIAIELDRRKRLSTRAVQVAGR